MPRYYFDLQSGCESLRDAQGVMARDLDQVVTEARFGIQDMHESGELIDASGWTLVIRDEQGGEVQRMAI
ncbi:hypothetical protein HCU64_03315 [Methylobacterium sp. C25]|uniref:DUF6894 family protein n=1 Tax=Methylobacterium sp. C25 TaxID=2721622 RepID=UPI001F41AC23|nr:hypothetical protein [Methylobacterium sp. C25]MCE4222769.1 hypothetical protein [Methylobacterium sp. C25]